MELSAFGVVVTVVVMLAIAVFILLFERRRARGIEQDLRRDAGEDRDEPDRD